MKKSLTSFLPVFLLLLTTGCGSLSLGGGRISSGDSTVRQKFDPVLDKMTYDEVIKDMWDTWGEPTYMTEGADRNILTLTYHKKSEKIVTKTVYHKADFLDEATSESEQVKEAENIQTYEFIFDKENKLLRWYSYYHYANDHIQENFESGNRKYRYLNDEKLDYITGSDKKKIVNQVRGLSPVKAQAAAPVKPVQPALSPLEQKLNELKRLKDKKAITDEEYIKMREKALNDYK